MKAQAYVALLRGVNVGGNNKLPMTSLAALCEAQGCTGVRTYIQSGNVVFRANAKTAAGFAAKLTEQIKDEFGFNIDVMVRSTDDMRSVVQSNPFLKPGVDLKLLHVTFLGDKPAAADIAKLNPVIEGGEVFAVQNREIYLYMPNGIGRSKMAVYRFDKILHTTCTGRNWQTVNKLLALMEE